MTNTEEDRAKGKPVKNLHEDKTPFLKSLLIHGLSNIPELQMAGSCNQKISLQSPKQPILKSRSKQHQLELIPAIAAPIPGMDR
jgi:hypothetical protein